MGPKVFFYDTGMVKGDDGAKFENHCALSLLKDLFLFAEKNVVKSNLNYIMTQEKKRSIFVGSLMMKSLML